MYSIVTGQCSLLYKMCLSPVTLYCNIASLYLSVDNSDNIDLCYM